MNNLAVFKKIMLNQDIKNVIKDLLKLGYKDANPNSNLIGIHINGNMIEQYTLPIVWHENDCIPNYEPFIGFVIYRPAYIQSLQSLQVCIIHPFKTSSTLPIKRRKYQSVIFTFSNIQKGTTGYKGSLIKAGDILEQTKYFADPLIVRQKQLGITGKDLGIIHDL